MWPFNASCRSVAKAPEWTVFEIALLAPASNARSSQSPSMRNVRRTTLGPSLLLRETFDQRDRLMEAIAFINERDLRTRVRDPGHCRLARIDIAEELERSL
jgi:hypothetical protein